MKYLSTPVVTDSLIREWHEASAVKKPTALGTDFRYSSSHGCARQQAYNALDATPTEPMDEAGAWATGLGTLIHEKVQEAIARRYPGAEFEVASGDGVVSGSCDALISIHDIGSTYGGTHVLWELKTMGSYGFDKQVGWGRMKSTTKTPEGPAAKAVAQAGMNALGIENNRPGVRIETLILGSITFEALSKNKAYTMGVEGVNRFLAEFLIPREEWEPLARQELDRIHGVAEDVANGFIPERRGVDDDVLVMQLNPTSGRHWQCDYCAFRTLCIEDGPGYVRITDSVVANG